MFAGVLCLSVSVCWFGVCSSLSGECAWEPLGADEACQCLMDGGTRRSKEATHYQPAAGFKDVGIESGKMLPI